MQPEPKTSHALSAAAAITGNPSGSPVCLDASLVIFPKSSEGFTKSTNFSRSIGNNLELMSLGLDHCCFL